MVKYKSEIRTSIDRGRNRLIAPERKKSSKTKPLTLTLEPLTLFNSNEHCSQTRTAFLLDANTADQAEQSLQKMHL